MAKVIEAIYENGVFKPLEKVNLKEGERVKIRIEESFLDVIERLSEKFKDVEVKEDPLDVLLEMRRRPWDW